MKENTGRTTKYHLSLYCSRNLLDILKQMEALIGFSVAMTLVREVTICFPSHKWLVEP